MRKISTKIIKLYVSWSSSKFFKTRYQVSQKQQNLSKFLFGIFHHLIIKNISPYKPILYQTRDPP